MTTVHEPLQTEIQRFHRRALALLAGWIGLGLLALLMLPAARGFNEWVGWLPFWLLLAPASSLMVLQRSRIGHWLHTQPVQPALRRRRRAAQASRPARRSSDSALRASLAALLPH